jgi:hypothetical protein
MTSRRSGREPRRATTWPPLVGTTWTGRSFSAHAIRAMAFMVRDMAEGRTLQEGAAECGKGRFSNYGRRHKLAWGLKEHLGSEAIPDAVRVPQWQGTIMADREKAGSFSLQTNSRHRHPALRCRRVLQPAPSSVLHEWCEPRHHFHWRNSTSCLINLPPKQRRDWTPSLIRMLMSD